MNKKNIVSGKIVGAGLSAALLALGLILLFAQEPAKAQTVPPDALKFFKNYFVTGDYAVGGVGLRGMGVGGIATGEINISGVPEGADIQAAFLYWQVVSTSTLGPDSGSLPVTFNGHALRSADGPFGKVLDLAGTPPCWSSGGTTGGAGGNKLTYTYRADVLRFLDIDSNPLPNPGYGKYIVNRPHQVQLPDSGSGNSLPIGLGASLVVVYRTEDPLTPLSAIVLYDGGYTLNNSSPTMYQTIKGFYQPSTTPNAKITHIVGSGQANKSETLWINDTQRLGVSPFEASAGNSWDNPTFPNLDYPDALNLGLSSEMGTVTTSVNPSNDCLTWGAVIFKTEVQDTDGDGLLDVWENQKSGTQASLLLDPNGQPLPILGDMGADPAVKDLFIEIGYMNTVGDTSYGGVFKPAHTHLPTPEALKLMGDAFAAAPTGAIKVHFDVGSPGLTWDPGLATQYIVPSDFARGGEPIPESSTLCSRGATDPVWECQFGPQPTAEGAVSTPGYPGTVGWKTGFRFLRDQLVSASAPELNLDGSDPCDAPGNDGPGQLCERRFDRNRKDIFHYALFAHAVGLPKSPEPCLDASGNAVPVNDTVLGLCTGARRDNPDFHAPRTNTGVGDYRGADILLSLGAFSDIFGAPVGGASGVWTPFPVGTKMNVAGTLMHEFGHNAWRRHGGEAFEPNCKPTYLSIMNYLYQLRGLLTDRGESILDFSHDVYPPPIDETLLSDGFTATVGLPYRIGWYAPIADSYLAGRGTPARKHCDGSDLLRDPAGVLTEVPMVRIDARSAADPLYPIDWKGNGTSLVEPPFTLDINFDGRTTATVGGTDPQVLRGSNDWSNLALNQIGSRRNVGGLFIDRDNLPNVGPLSLDVGRGDAGRGDAGRGDAGRGDAGVGDLSRGDLGRGDAGRGDAGRGDAGRGDAGRGDAGRGDAGGGDLFANDPNNPGGELDFETAADLAKTPPNEFTACVIGVGGCPGGGVLEPLHRISLGWTAPNVGNVHQFIVYRLPGSALVPDRPSTPWVQVGRVETVPDQTEYSLIDGTELVDKEQYTYFAVAEYHDDVKPGEFIQSDPSNVVTITAINDPVAAGNDDYTTDEDTPLIVAKPGVLENDRDPDSAVATLTAVLVVGPSNGTLVLKADGSFAYTPGKDYNGSASFTYSASAGTAASNVATVTVTINPVNDAPVASDGALGTAEDMAGSGTLSAVDIDSPSLSYSLVANRGKGTATITNPATGAYTYVPYPDANGTDTFTFQVTDGSAASNVATVTVTITPVNDPPTISDITDRAIDWNTSTGALTFTINDPDGLNGATVSGSSSNTALVPVASIVFGGSGTARTVTVTPAPNQSGTATITVLVTDSGGSMASDAFQLTVNQVAYTLFGLQNVPPAVITKSKAGSTVPMKWQFKNGLLVVNSSGVHHTVTVQGGSLNKDFSDTDPGSSSFRYDATTKTWYFNLQTKDPITGVAYPVGTYTVTIKPTTPGYLPSLPFILQLTK